MATRVISLDESEILLQNHNSKCVWNDEELAVIWNSLTDVPFDENDRLDCDEWFGFKRGADKYEDIWKWFDKNLSMGLGKFMEEKVY